MYNNVNYKMSVINYSKGREFLVLSAKKNVRTKTIRRDEERGDLNILQKNYCINTLTHAEGIFLNISVENGKENFYAVLERTVNH